MDQTNDFSNSSSSTTISTPVTGAASVVITPLDISNNGFSVINLNGNKNETGGMKY